MKRWLEKHFGKSYKTTLVSYMLAIGAVLQPIIESTVYAEDFKFTYAFAFRLFFAAGMAFLGKWAADSSQVKEVDKKVDNHISE